MTLKGRLTSIQHRDAIDLAIESFDYTYNLVDQVVSETTFDDEIDYQYDQTDQLIQADSLVQASVSYSYDASGNRQDATHIIGAEIAFLPTENLITYTTPKAI